MYLQLPHRSPLSTSLSLLLLLPFLLFSPAEAGITCGPIPDAPPGPAGLPTKADCEFLIFIMKAAVFQRGDPPVLYGTFLPDTEETMGTPKFWEIKDEPGKPPNTCAILINNPPGDYYAAETLFYENFIKTGEAVLARCILREGKLGWDKPGMEGMLQVGVARSQGTGPLGEDAEGEGDGQGKDGEVVIEVEVDGGKRTLVGRKAVKGGDEDGKELTTLKRWRR